MLVLTSAVPYISWGERRAKLFKSLLHKALGSNVTSYQLHKLINNHVDFSVSNLKKIMGDAGKDQTAQTAPLDKVLKICEVLSIEPKELLPVVEIDAPKNFADPIDTAT